MSIFSFSFERATDVAKSSRLRARFFEASSTFLVLLVPKSSRPLEYPNLAPSSFLVLSVSIFC